MQVNNLEKDLAIFMINRGFKILFIPKEWIDKEVAMYSIMKFPHNLRWLEEYSDDYDIVLAALTKDPFTLTFASERLQKDKELILKIIKIKPLAITLVNRKLFDAEFVKNIREIVPESIQYIFPYV